MFFRIFLVGALIVAVMLAVKDGRVLRRVGLTGSCSRVAAPADESGFWEACTKGRLSGPPDLTRQGCTSHGVRGRIEYWRCPTAIDSSSGS
jgi:hypothetical protein